MNNLSYATIKELKELLSNGQISQKEIVQDSLNKYEKYKNLETLYEAFDIDSILKLSNESGILSGIPGVLKDNICQKSRKLTCGSKILANFISPYDSTASSRLKDQGALLLGRASMDEFAMGSSGETSAFEIAKNPWDSTRVPGGSSSGSIAAVAADIVPFSLGSETGGSVRLPAAFCGVVGLKPTYGRISRFGLVAYGSSLDQIGIATRTVYDNALVLSAIAGHDKNDATSLKNEFQDFTKNLNGEFKKDLKIGVIKNAFNKDGLDPEIKVAIDKAILNLESLGAKIVEIDLPTLDYGAATYFIISRAEAASNLARFDGVRYGLRTNDEKSLMSMYESTRHDGFGQEVRARILVGNYVLSAGHASQFYSNAKRVISLMKAEFKQKFQEVDLFLMPTHSTPAFKFGEFNENKLAMDLQDYFTAPINLTGVPAISIPIGFTKNNMPIGMQLVADHENEDLMFQVAHAYEQNNNWHKNHPF